MDSAFIGFFFGFFCRACQDRHNPCVAAPAGPGVSLPLLGIGAVGSAVAGAVVLRVTEGAVGAELALGAGTPRPANRSWARCWEEPGRLPVSAARAVPPNSTTARPAATFTATDLANPRRLFMTMTRVPALLTGRLELGHRGLQADQLVRSRRCRRGGEEFAQTGVRVGPPSARPRGTIETLRTGSAPGSSMPSTAWPDSW